jgi:hypothetical protein
MRKSTGNHKVKSTQSEQRPRFHLNALVRVLLAVAKVLLALAALITALRAVVPPEIMR